MPRKAFTEQGVERLRPPKDKRLEIDDKTVPGLVLRVTSNGAKSWSVLYRTYEAWREGDHDDTVLATALACWFAERMLPGIERPGSVVRGYPLDGRSRAAAPFPGPALR